MLFSWLQFKNNIKKKQQQQQNTLTRKTQHSGRPPPPHTSRGLIDRFGFKFRRLKCRKMWLKETSKQTGLSSATVNPILLHMPLFPSCVRVRACARVPAFEHVQTLYPCWASQAVALMEEFTKLPPFLERINYCLGKLCLSSACVCVCVRVLVCLCVSMKPTPAL